MFGYSGFLTGGTEGVEFLLHYATDRNFDLTFFIINIPFYILAWQRMGIQLTLKTFAVAARMAFIANLIPRLIGFQHISTAFAAVMVFDYEFQCRPRTTNPNHSIWSVTAAATFRFEVT